MKIGVVAVCTIPLVAASQKNTYSAPFWHYKNVKSTFYMLSQKTLVTKVVGLGEMHISAQNGVKIRTFAMELAQTMVIWVESQDKSCLVPFFMKSFSLKHWYVMFDIFLRYYIIYHDSMR
jgi:hypothetical protein